MPRKWRRECHERAFHWFMALVLLVQLRCYCFAREKPADAPRTETMTAGPVTVTFRIDPPKVELHRDLFLTVEISAPSEFNVKLPHLDDRVQGFIVNGTFDEEPQRRDGQKVLIRRVRLTPLISQEYRIAPMAIEYEDTTRSPRQSTWFATRPISLDLRPPVSGVRDGDVADNLRPVRIRPPLRIVTTYFLAALVGLAVIAALWFAVKRVREKVRLARLSPRERALRELAKLLARDLVTRNRIKEFYLELTMIVRRYIERAHGIRAPEQTTEEFLAAAHRDPRFPAETVKKLADFLEAADLVKFAAFRPDLSAIDRAVTTAREYIETDRYHAQTEDQVGVS
ncbi:MAG: hypothetical protein ACUVWX_03130 [Kiritimatiellia bacterium]